MKRPLAALLLAIAPLAAQAETLSHTWTPRTAEEAQALRAGIALHGLHNGLRKGGTIRQWGRDNFAALSQSGTGNRALVIQRGRDHSATVTQTGDDNAQVLIQVGRGATAEVAQSGGEAGITFQVGRPDQARTQAPPGG